MFAIPAPPLSFFIILVKGYKIQRNVTTSSVPEIYKTPGFDSKQPGSEHEAPAAPHSGN
jgi:hypothetical protein